jgi:DNA-binding transcriptional ArsR family regulator/protein-L-isoaspartate O-methyltransferase
MDAESAATPRWELYRLLAEPVRLRLLALAAEEELAIGELAELLGEGQPNVSRHVAPLRKAHLLSVRKHGTRVLVRLSEQAERDPVVRDGVAAGRALCTEDGSLGRIAEVVAQRDQSAREFFAQSHQDTDDPRALPPELPAYLSALAPLIARRRLAVDVGTGSGVVLDVLAPLFEGVVAVDREAVQLERARLRLRARGYDHVTLVHDAFDSARFAELVRGRGGADVVFASRVLHHAPKPASAVEALTSLLAPGGALIVLDYAVHEDESMREREADVWLGFEADELAGFARRAGLHGVAVSTIPGLRRGPGHAIGWQTLIAYAAEDDERAPRLRGAEPLRRRA